MSVELYGLEHCGTCTKARDWLNSHKIRHRFSEKAFAERFGP